MGFTYFLTQAMHKKTTQRAADASDARIEAVSILALLRALRWMETRLKQRRHQRERDRRPRTDARTRPPVRLDRRTDPCSHGRPPGCSHWPAPCIRKRSISSLGPARRNPLADCSCSPDASRTARSAGSGNSRTARCVPVAGDYVTSRHSPPAALHARHTQNSSKLPYDINQHFKSRVVLKISSISRNDMRPCLHFQGGSIL